MTSLVNLLQHQQPQKVSLYRSLQEKFQNGPCFHANFIRKVAATMKSAFTGKQSTSLMICGENEICIQVIRKVQQLLLSHTPGRQVTNEEISQHTARISGQLVDADSSAILCLANQFLFRKRSDRDMNSALEDLQVYLAARKVEGFPATIIIEDFDRYSMQKRQTLIYTLLDMMHCPEYLFIVIGLTSRLDAFAHLERRVASRMASQHLTLPFPEPSEICAELCWLLTQHNPFNTNNANLILSQEADSNNILNRQFNDSVEELLGRFELRLLSLTPPVPLINQAADIAILEGDMNALIDDSAINNHEMIVHNECSMTVAQLHASEAHQYEIIMIQPGTAFDSIATLVSLGQDRRYFQQAASNIIRLLKPSSDRVLTLELFHRAFESNEPQMLVDKLCELSTMELTLYTIIAHNQCQRIYGGNEAFLSPVEQSVNEIVKAFDNYTDFLSGKGMPVTQVMHYFHRLQTLELISLWTGVKGEEIKTITQLSVSFGPSVIVTVEHTTAEITAAYKEEPDCLLNWRPMKEKSKLMINEKMRRLILQPQQTTTLMAREHDRDADQKSLL